MSAGVLGLGIVRCGGGGGGSTGDGGRRGDRVGEHARAGERERERDREGECKEEGERREGARRRRSIGASLDIREAEMPRVEPLTAVNVKVAVGLGGRIPFPGIDVFAMLDFCKQDAFSGVVVVLALASLFTCSMVPVAAVADADEDEDEDPSRGLGGGRIDLASCSFLRLTISALTRCLHFSCWAESSSTLMTCPSPPNHTRCPSSFSATRFASSWLPKLTQTMPSGAPVYLSDFPSKATTVPYWAKWRRTCGYGVSGLRPVTRIAGGGGGPVERSSHCVKEFVNKVCKRKRPDTHFVDEWVQLWAKLANAARTEILSLRFKFQSGVLHDDFWLAIGGLTVVSADNILSL